MRLNHDQIRSINDLVLLGRLVVKLNSSVVRSLVGNNSCLVNDNSFLLFIVESSISSLLRSLIA